MELGVCRSPSPCLGGLQPYRRAPGVLGPTRADLWPDLRGFLNASLGLRGGGEGGISYPVCYILRKIKVCDLVWYKRRGHPQLAPKVLVARRAWALVGQNLRAPFVYKLA